MNFKITFEENARRGKEILKNQKSVTFEQAKAQVERLKRNSKCNNMGIMFGGRAREEEEISESEKQESEGFRKGLKAGYESAISKCQLAMSQTLILTHDQKLKFWDELEKLR